MRTTWVAMLAITLAAAGCAKPPQTAAEAFKDICVDTKTAPEAVTKAVRAAGGSETKVVVPPSQVATTKARFWDLKIGGKAATVAQVVFRPATAAGEPQQRDESCGVVMPSGDRASVEEVRTWIADRADPPYEFYDLDARKPITGHLDRAKARDEDKLWKLVVMDSGAAAYFNITHERLDR
jgi:hypothetical protein